MILLQILEEGIVPLEGKEVREEDKEEDKEEEEEEEKGEEDVAKDKSFLLLLLAVAL